MTHQKIFFYTPRQTNTAPQARRCGSVKLITLNIFIALCCLASCKPLTTHPKPAPVRLFVKERTPDSARGLIYDPAPALTNLSLCIQGTGPGTATLAPQQLTSDQTYLDLWLEPGSWLLEATATDDSGRIFLAGLNNALVHPVYGYTGHISLQPVAGLGALELAYNAPETVSAAAFWDLSLTKPSGELLDSWTDSMECSTRLIENIASGYYILHSRISDQDLVVTAESHLVRILASYTTLAELGPIIRQQSASGFLLLQDSGPWATGIQLLSRAVVRGFPIRLAATGPADATYRWFSATELLGQGHSLLLASRNLPARFGIDLIAVSESGAGAASIELTINTTAAQGDYAEYTRINPTTDPAAIGLQQVAEMAGSANSRLLAILSDTTYSQLDIWRYDEARAEAVLSSSTNIRFEGSRRRATRLAMNPQGTYVAVANSESNWLAILELRHDGNLQLNAEFKGGTALPTGFNYLRGLAFSDDGNQLYVLANSSRAVYSFTLVNEQWQQAQVLLLDSLPSGSLSTLRTMAINQAGDVLAIAAAGSDAVILLDITSSGLVWRGQARPSVGHTTIRYPQALCFLPGTRLLAVSCRDNSSIQILDYSLSSNPQTTGAIQHSDGLPAEAAQSLSPGDVSGMVLAATKNGLALVSVDATGMLVQLHAFFMDQLEGLPLPISAVGRLGQWLLAGQPASTSLVLFGRPALP